MAHDGRDSTPDGSGDDPQHPPAAEGTTPAGQTWPQQAAARGPLPPQWPASAGPQGNPAQPPVVGGPATDAGWPVPPAAAPAAPAWIQAASAEAGPPPAWAQPAPPSGWAQPAPSGPVQPNQQPNHPPTGQFPAAGPPTGSGKPATVAPWAVGAAAAPPPSTGWAPAQPSSAPPPAGPPPASPSDDGGSRTGRRILAAVVVLCLAAAAAGVTWYVRRDGDAPTDTAQPTSSFGAPQSSSTDDEAPAPTSSRPTSTAPAATTSAAPTPTVSPEDQALASLQALRASSLSGLVLDDRWVAQVASKSVGITDPLQTAQNGTHRFFAVDILAESRQAVVSVADPAAVLVLQSSDFGKRSYAPDGQPYWVTMVDLGFGSSDAVKTWCASTYSTLTPEQLANACAARTLSAPHD